MNLTPVGDKIIVKVPRAKEKSDGGIFIPEAAKEVPLEGLVVAAGPGKILDSGIREEPCVKVGDTVMYRKYTGNGLFIKGEEHLVMRYEEVLAVVETRENITPEMIEEALGAERVIDLKA